MRRGIVVAIISLLTVIALASGVVLHYSSKKVTTVTAATTKPSSGTWSPVVTVQGASTTTQVTQTPKAAPVPASSPSDTSQSSEANAAENAKLTKGANCYGTITPIANTYKAAISSDDAMTNNAVNAYEEKANYSGDQSYVNELYAQGNAALEKAYSTYMQGVKSLNLESCNTEKPPILN
jgi:hypothetical protein